MRGVIRFEAPAETKLTLAVTATLKEWREIFAALPSDGSSAGVLEKQIGDLIRKAEDALASASWTTGYAHGELSAAEETA